MPIDFNANFVPNPNNNGFQQKISMASFLSGKGKQDTFVKTVNVGNAGIDKDYEGITISESQFGTINKTGETAKLYTITNKNGASVKLSSFGATITSVSVPDKNGKMIDVTQGYENVTPYETAPVGHAGGTIGPCANKINNGEFTINGVKYELEKNKDSGRTHCHGGSDGFDVKNWEPKVLPDGVEFTYYKKDMENGYPGNVTAKVTYKFDNDNNLHIKYSATTDKDTLINMTNHTYFNLDGAENTQENSVYDHVVKLPNSSKFTENNEIAIPTGKVRDVKNTPFDFSVEKRIGDVIDSDYDQMKIGSGFDQNYCIDGYNGKSLIDIAEVKSQKTGIKLKVSTNLPGFQFYTANHLGKSAQPAGKSGFRYEKRSSLCVEPQFYPNAINTREFKEKGILKKGQEYNREIVYSFSVSK
ncbi:MAG: galactose mutarotase [Alphaproteobacteria bacterium]|nr:galactose mutarotase [Alphaproteobacteria bacterium]